MKINRSVEATSFINAIRNIVDAVRRTLAPQRNQLIPQYVRVREQFDVVRLSSRDRIMRH